MSGQRKKNGPLVADRRYRNKTAQPKSQASTRKTPNRKATRAKPKPRRGPIGALIAMIGGAIGFVLRIVWGVFWRGTAAVMLFVAGGVAYYASTLPPIEDLVDGRVQGSVTMLDQYGDVFATRGSQFGGAVSATSVSQHLHDAIIATEDKRFYWHPGIDPRGIASAVRINLAAGRGPLSGNGGSTLTQQTAKLLCIGRPYDPTVWENEAAYEADCRTSSLWRKAQEAVYAMAMEVMYTKEEILTIYLNRAYMGGASYGAEAAANRFFGITAAELNPQQAAMLAGLLQAPSALAPTANLERSQARSLTVLRLMYDQGYLSEDRYTIARTNPATLTPSAEEALPGGIFADWVMGEAPDFFTTGTTEDVVIETTLDPRIQEVAEQALLSTFEERLRDGSEVQGAIIVMSADGAVRAMVGGRDVRASGVFNRAVSARRQPGSAFKPFIFGAALDLGYSPNDIIVDEPICWTTPGSGEWCPQNYDQGFRGPLTLDQSLAASRNIPAIVLSETVGRETVQAVASGFGIESDMANGPALALGVSEVSLIELTGAYAGILNGGNRVLPFGVQSLTVRGDMDPILEQTGGIRERVISEDAARQLTWMMNQVMEQGTGQAALVPGHPLAGKTGTTNESRDAWFVGFSGDYVVGVWMGYDDNTPMQGVTGSGMPAEIWRRTMAGVLAEVPPVRLPMMPPIGAGGTVEVADALRISDAELERILNDQFGSVATSPGGSQTVDDGTVGNILDQILGD